MTDKRPDGSTELKLPGCLLAVFTGAGISVASGLPTFDGSYRGIQVREILEHDFFLERTRFFYDFYRDVLLRWADAEPNGAHRAIAAVGCPVVTQNIDGLHQRAGSPGVTELHGNLRELRCEVCSHVHPSSLASSGTLVRGVPHCPDCGGLLKPVVVLFGEDVDEYEAALGVMLEAERVLVVGTSLTVYPAAGLVGLARERGATVEIVNSRADEEVPRALERLLAG